MIRMDGKKMSKSRGNLVTPSRYFDTVGADALRLFHLFAGPPGDNMDWTDQTENVIDGCGRFLDRVWRLTVERRRSSAARATRRPEDVGDHAGHAPAHRQGERRPRAVVVQHLGGGLHGVLPSSCQRYQRERPRGPTATTNDAAADALLLLLAPLVPHVAAEAWERRHGEGAMVHAEPWPTFDPELARSESVTMVVQVNGKVRDRIEVSPDITEDEAVALAAGVGAGGRARSAEPSPPAWSPGRLGSSTSSSDATAAPAAGARGAVGPRPRALYAALNPANSSWILSSVHPVRGVEAHSGDHVAVALDDLGRDLADVTGHGERVEHVVGMRSAISTHSPRFDSVLSSLKRSPQPWSSSTGW